MTKEEIGALKHGDIIHYPECDVTEKFFAISDAYFLVSKTDEKYGLRRFEPGMDMVDSIGRSYTIKEWVVALEDARKLSNAEVALFKL